MFATGKSVLTVANEKGEASFSHSYTFSVFRLMYRPISYFFDIIMTSQLKHSVLLMLVLLPKTHM